MSSNYQINLTTTPYQIVVPQTVVGAQIAKAGRIPIPNGSDTGAVTFNTVLTNTAYSVQLTIMNTADSFPQDLIVRVSGFTVNTLTVKLNATTDTGNYIVCWALIGSING